MNTPSKPHLFGVSLGAVLALILLSTCTTVPETNPGLAEARQQVNAAQQMPAVTQHAALQLQEAKESLTTAESLWEEEGMENVEAVEHHAYLAKQQANIAMQRAAVGEAREEMELAGATREQILRQAREQELQTAQQRVEQAERQALTARQRAQELERQAQQREQAQVTQADEQQLRELRQTVESLQAQQTQRGMVLTLGDVLFDFGDAQLKPGGERAVEQVATFLERNPDRQLVVEGYTDSVGDEDFNRELARRRADAVRDQLLAAGVNSDRIRIEAYGEQYPVATNDTVAGRQLNRRVEVVLARPGEDSPEGRDTRPQNQSTEPQDTEPRQTEPQGTEPQGTEPQSTEPRGTEPQGTEPRGMEPQGTEPQRTEPQGTEPQRTEPQSTEPQDTEPRGGGEIQPSP